MQVLGGRARAWRPGAAVLIAAIVLSIRGSAQTLSAEGVLDQYAAGNADRVVGALAVSSESVSAFSRDLKSTAPGWINSKGPASARKRELAVATVALEAARWMKPAPFGSYSMMRDDPTWESRFDLMEWACALLRKEDRPLAAERSWHLASLALLEESSALFNASWNLRGRTRSHVHVAHARARFPDESRIDLAEAVIDLEASGILGSPLMGKRTPYVEVVEESGTPSVPGTFSERDTRKQVQLSVAEFVPLLADEHVGAEAQLRLGAIELELMKPERALAHLTETLRLTTDPFLCYHARFFRGAAYTTLTRPEEAESDYRAALDLAPHAQSATVGLAWLLTVTHRPTEASTLVSEALSSNAISTDPYASYEHGDFRLWTQYIADLRAAIQ